MKETPNKSCDIVRIYKGKKEETLRPEYEHELTLYSQEEFIKRFNNFHLIFTVDDPEYLPKIKQFIQVDYPAEFAEIKRKLKVENLSVKTIKENITILYKIYLALKQKGNFSNKELGLEYW